MEHTHVEIADLVSRIDRGEIRLPEIQRAYVWKPAQVAHLVDSLYRRYPSGAMLLWRPAEDIEERDPALDPSSLRPMATPQYLLDGQQRLTSLHRVFHRHNDAQVVFNVADEKFQVQSAATAKDVRWVRVADVLESEKPSQIRKGILEGASDLDEDVVDERLARLREIRKYRYYLEIITDLSYEEVAQIFVRVNSRGRALRTVDLTLATLSARWKGVVKKVEEEAAACANRGWPRMDPTFLVRALAATATPTATLPQLTTTPIPELEDGWKRVTHGVDFLIRVLQNNAKIETSQLIPSMNALVPLVVLLSRFDKDNEFTESDALRYWLLSVFVTGRFSAAADSKIATDALAARSDEPLKKLYANAQLLGQNLAITEQQLVGKGAGSPFFLLSYLAAKKRGAKDWWHDVEIAHTGGGGGFAIEYHHIHPQKTLRDKYVRAEINDLANLAFISATANKKISDRSPSVYFDELLDPTADRDELSPHLVPLEEKLRTSDQFREFLFARRRLLARAMTELLDEVRPSWVTDTPTDTPSEEVASLSFDWIDTPEPTLWFTARRGEITHTDSLPVSEFDRFLREIEDGLTSSITIDGQTVDVGPEDEDIPLPLGPLQVTGSLVDWRSMLDREEQERSTTGAPERVVTTGYTASARLLFSVLDSE